ncbi:MAG: hypothetical protein ACOC2W_02055 [bacterium]
MGVNIKECEIIELFQDNFAKFVTKEYVREDEEDIEDSIYRWLEEWYETILVPMNKEEKEYFNNKDITHWLVVKCWNDDKIGFVIVPTNQNGLIIINKKYGNCFHRSQETEINQLINALKQETFLKHKDKLEEVKLKE